MNGDRPPSPPAHELIHGLQQAAGNRAVQRLLAATRPAELRLQRWSAHEHVTLGDAGGTVVDLGHGFVLTQGEIVALAGDHYGTFDQMMAEVESHEGRARLKALVEDVLKRDASGMGPVVEVHTSDEMKTAREENEKSYEALALDNFSHFVEGGRARSEWLMYHTQAIAQAVEAGLQRDQRGRELALAREAFGQHFLTDAFSAGHIRTPRREIVDHYTDVGRRVVDEIVEYVGDRIVDGLMGQVVAACPHLDPSWRPPGPRWVPQPSIGGRMLYRRVVEHFVSGQVHGGIRKAVNASGIDLMQEFGRYIGGLLALKLHDMDNEAGVAVRSDARPEGWLAKGDSHLHESPESQSEASSAVYLATLDIESAFTFGLQESPLPVEELPTTVGFDLDSDVVTGDAVAPVETLARHMELEPTTYVTLTGHTDPMGTEDYNVDLGNRRAHAVAAVLAARGVDGARIAILDSPGETRLIERDPRRYARNRRVEIAYAQGLATGVSPGLDRAARQTQALGPPFAAEAHIPEVDPDRQADPQPEWHWGRLDTALRKRVNDEAKAFLAQRLGSAAVAISSVKELQPSTERICGPDLVTLDPGAVVGALLQELAKDPLGLLERAAAE